MRDIMISDNILIFIVLFVLIYVCEDNLFALFTIFVFSVILLAGIISTVSSSTAEEAFLFAIIMIWSLLAIIQWVVRFIDDRKKQKELLR